MRTALRETLRRTCPYSIGSIAQGLFPAAWDEDSKDDRASRVPLGAFEEEVYSCPQLSVIQRGRAPLISR